MDLYWRENLICPTEPEYIEMVNNSTHSLPSHSLFLSTADSLSCLSLETGGLFRIAIKLMMAASGENPPRLALPHTSPHNFLTNPPSLPLSLS